ncbi:MAG: FAD-dependent oxidoreductase [Nitriliruptor sp.]
MSADPADLPGTLTDAPYAALPAARPPLGGSRSADVVVVGGGIVGVTTALRLAERGFEVVLLEAHRIAGGTSGRSTGKVTSQHGPIYAELTDRHGSETARFYAARNEAAVHTIADLVDEHTIDCQLETVATHLHALTARGAATLRREATVARELGLPAVLTDDAPVPDVVSAAVRFDDQRQFDPRAYVVGLADATEEQGAVLHEHSPVRKVRPRRGRVTVHTDTGVIDAGHVVLAMLTPWPDPVGAFARAHPSRAICVAAELDGPVPADPSLGVDGPSRSTRRFVGPDGAERLILVTSGWRPGATDERDAFRELTDDAVHRWGATRLTHRWGAMDQVSTDLLPMVGGVSGDAQLLVATGFSKWGMTGGTVAAELLTARIAGEGTRTPFDAARLPDVRAVAKMAAAGARFGYEIVRDRIPRPGAARAVDDVTGTVGAGRIVATPTGPVAVCTAADGTVCARSATCTHLGCTVRWNDAAGAWDCACHGSRFAPTGEVLSGPATSPLKPRDVPGR